MNDARERVDVNICMNVGSDQLSLDSVPALIPSHVILVDKRAWAFLETFSCLITKLETLAWQK
jgi:hypothetical protein